MDTDLFVGMLKIISVLIAGALGITGLLTNYRDASNKLTAAGKAVLLGILISTFVGAVTSGIEAHKSRSSGIEQAVRTEAIVGGLTRSVLSIRRVAVSYSFELPTDHPMVQRYVDRVRANIEDRLYPGGRKNKQNGLTTTRFNDDGSIRTVSIHKESDLWPNAQEDLIRRYAETFSVALYFRRAALETIDMNIVGDLEVKHVDADYVALEWDRSKARIALKGANEFPEEDWSANGKIKSLPDLYGSQIIFLLPIAGDRQYRGGNPLDMRALNFLRSLNLISIEFDFGEGKRLSISGQKFRKMKMENGIGALSVVLPKDPIEFASFTSYKLD